AVAWDPRTKLPVPSWPTTSPPADVVVNVVPRVKTLTEPDEPAACPRLHEPACTLAPLIAATDPDPPFPTISVLEKVATPRSPTESKPEVSDPEAMVAPVAASVPFCMDRRPFCVPPLPSH